MNIGVEMIGTNVGMAIENIVLLCLVIGSLVIFALKFEAGLIWLFTTTGAAFILEYLAGWNYTNTLIVFFLSIVLMALSLLFQDRATAGVQLQ